MRVWILACILAFLSGGYATKVYYGYLHGKQVEAQIKQEHQEAKSSTTEQTALVNAQNKEAQERNKTQIITLVKYVKEHKDSKCISSPDFVSLYNSGLREAEITGATSTSNAGNTK